MKILKAVFICLFTAAASGAAVPSGLTVKFERTTVTASGVTRGANVVFYAAGLEPLGYVSSIVRIQRVGTDDDHDGIVTLDLQRDVPQKTIWAVVDLTNAQYAIATPAAHDIDVAAESLASVRKGQNGAPDRFAIRFNIVEALYVHPGLGAWAVHAQDGDQSDRDAANGTTLISLDEMRPLAGSGGPPADIRPGGILIAIDYSYMRVVVLRIDGTVLGGAR